MNEHKEILIVKITIVIAVSQSVSRSVSVEDEGGYGEESASFVVAVCRVWV